MKLLIEHIAVMTGQENGMRQKYRIFDNEIGTSHVISSVKSDSFSWLQRKALEL